METTVFRLVRVVIAELDGRVFQPDCPLRVRSFWTLTLQCWHENNNLPKRPFNRPFSSWFEPHCESEATCKVFITKISFQSYANKANFHMKSFALFSLVFILRFTATRKWAIHFVFPFKFKFCNPSGEQIKNFLY